MFDNFILNAMFAGIGVAIAVGVIGCFVVWRKMAYFGDSIAHSSLLGVAMGLVLSINQNISVIMICFVFALFLLYLQQQKILSSDVLLGILAHSLLAIAVVIISLLNINFDLHSYLFGSILTVTKDEIYIIYLGMFISLLLVMTNWNQLILITINEDLAQAQGVSKFFIDILFTLLITIVVAIAIRIVGILLITSMLIIPAASARQLVKSPELMAIVSVIFAIISVILGILSSNYFDTPASPSIVMVATLIFILVLLLNNIFKLNLKK